MINPGASKTNNSHIPMPMMPPMPSAPPSPIVGEQTVAVWMTICELAALLKQTPFRSLGRYAS